MLAGYRNMLPQSSITTYDQVGKNIKHDFKQEKEKREIACQSIRIKKSIIQQFSSQNMGEGLKSGKLNLLLCIFKNVLGYILIQAE